MFDNINIRSSVAVYVQIENHVQFAVASGRLKPGDALPSLQEMAKKVKVNFNTVAKSYRDLEVMGILHTRRGSGAFISEGAEAKCRENCRHRIVARLHEVVAEAKAAGMSSPEIKAVCAASYASGEDPYGEVPEGVLALAKTKKS
jgi:GntR family transcriptional regulator